MIKSNIKSTLSNCLVASRYIMKSYIDQRRKECDHICTCLLSVCNAIQEDTDEPFQWILIHWIDISLNNSIDKFNRKITMTFLYLAHNREELWKRKYSIICLIKVLSYQVIGTKEQYSCPHCDWNVLTSGLINVFFRLFRNNHFRLWDIHIHFNNHVKTGISDRYLIYFKQIN